MLIQYNNQHCNLNSCSKEQARNLLCTYHNNIYIENSRIEKKIQRLERLISGKANLKDKFIYYRNFCIHYITGIHVPYIEHFPMQTLFLHYLPKILRDELPNENFTIEQFVSNFDYPENTYISNIKVKKNTFQFKSPFKAFANVLISYKKALWFAVFWLIFFLGQSYLNSLILNIPYSQIWNAITVILLNCFTVLVIGIYFINCSKNLIGDAISNNFLNSPERNKVFLNSSHSLIEKIRTMEENLWGLYGTLAAGICILIYNGYINIKSDLTVKYVIYFGYSILSTILVYLIVKTLWNNRFLIKLIRRIPTDSLKFDLYDKSRNIGLSTTMNFFRSIAAYNLAVVVALNLSFINLKNLGFEVDFVIILLVSYFFAWNYSSNFILGYKFLMVKKAFRAEKSTEMERLQNLTSAASITKYDFIKNLRLRFFPSGKIFQKIVSATLYITPIVLGYLIPKYQNELDNTVEKIIDSIINVF